MKELIRILVIVDICYSSQSYLEAVGRYARLLRATVIEPVFTARQENIVDT